MSKQNDDVTHKAKRIKLLILDVDGVLTDGTLYYANNGDELKRFHIHDGLGIQLAQQAGIEIAIISGKNSEPLSRRIQELGIKHAYLGCQNKLPPYEELKTKLTINDDEIAYMGDDLPDLPLLQRAGVAITVPNAVADVKQHVDYITHLPGGQGAVREACVLLLKAQSRYQDVLKSYFDNQT